AHPAFDADAVRADYVACVAAHARADIEAIGEVAGMRVRARDFEPSTWAIGLLGRAFSASELAQARKRLQQASRQIAEFFVRHDVFVTPTVATPPPRIGALQPSALEQRQLQLLGAIGSPALVRRSGLHEILGSEIFEFIPITPLANISGQPAMSVPLCRSGDDLPVGMHFEAAFGRDDLLLQLARQLEQARPW
ncbi:MAG TPA: amidase family protein, partial [Burkholderiaceae bacterium]|nr:amidase family protein [Burkholderiaceae bacterium]